MIFVHVAILCDKSKLDTEINKTKTFAAWNNFPKHVASKIVNNALRDKEQVHQPSPTVDPVLIYLRIPYLGIKGEQLVKNLKRKLKYQFLNNINVKFILTYDTYKLMTHINCYTNMEDFTPKMLKSYVVYKFDCPCCNAVYIGKTERTLHERCREHAGKVREK